MKSKVMNRPMFKKNGIDPENVGIMSGFKDMEDMGEDEDMPAQMLAMMGAEVEDGEGEDEDSSEKMMDRTPSSPEILMNNLRGDMRSIDARVEELADLVGYRAANETPTEVLALLQPVLAQQGAVAPPSAGVPAGMPMPPEAMGGIAGLPEAEMPAPIEGAPLNMAAGGIVQRFKEGSDEEGVTPASERSGPSFYSPDLIQRAQSEVVNFLAQKPSIEPSLAAQTRVREPLYRSLLGDTKDLTQAQILFDIAQGAFSYGANVDEQGRPLRGSQAARLMGAFRGVPGRIAARAGELEKQERAVKLAALQAAEKDVSNIREANVKLIDAQRKIYSDIAKNSGSAGFGKSVRGVALNTMYQYAPQYAAGILSPEMDRMFETAITEYQQKETYQDPVDQRIITRVPELPQFVKDALVKRRELSRVAPATTTPPGTSQTPPATAPATTTEAVTTAAPASTTPTNVVQTAAAPGTVVPPKGAVRPRTIWESAPDIAGPIPAAGTTIARIPGFGGIAPEMQQARNFVNAAVRDLIKNLQNNPRYAEGERKAIEAEVDIGPRFFDDAEGLRNRIIGIDDFLARKQKDAEREGFNDRLPVQTQRDYRSAAQSIADFRKILGVPIRLYDIEDVRKLPSGTPFLWNGTEQRIRQ